MFLWGVVSGDRLGLVYGVNAFGPCVPFLAPDCAQEERIAGVLEQILHPTEVYVLYPLIFEEFIHPRTEETLGAGGCS